MTNPSRDVYNLNQVKTLAVHMAEHLREGDVLVLKGDLGSGKTTFVRFLVRALVGEDITVPSPTFTLCQTYTTPKGTLYHYDLYRLKTTAEFEELGLMALLDQGITCIEWPDIIQDFLPPETWVLTFEEATLDTRKITLTRLGEGVCGT